MSFDLPPSLVEAKLRRLSLDQLRALLFLCGRTGAVSSLVVGEKIGLKGKSLGGIFSSLSRQKIRRQPLVLPYGREEGKRNLRWRFNEAIMPSLKVKSIIKKILEF